MFDPHCNILQEDDIYNFRHIHIRLYVSVVDSFSVLCTSLQVRYCFPAISIKRRSVIIHGMSDFFIYFSQNIPAVRMYVIIK